MPNEAPLDEDLDGVRVVLVFRLGNEHGGHGAADSVDAASSELPEVLLVRPKGGAAARSRLTRTPRHEPLETNHQKRTGRVDRGPGSDRVASLLLIAQSSSGFWTKPPHRDVTNARLGEVKR